MGRPNGLDGFLGVYVDEEDLVYFEPGQTVFVDEDPLIVRERRRGPKGHQVAFEGVTTRDLAEEIRGHVVYVAERRSLADDEFWPDDLVGLEVRPGGGEVVGVGHGPSQDRLIVSRDGSRFEIPFVPALVPVVDVAGGFVEIVEIEGLNSPSN